MLTDALGKLVDITWVEPLMASVWVLLILFAFSAIDAFFPIVPSESLVIIAGVYAFHTGDPNLVLAALAAALGAFVGDNIARLIGRGLGNSFFAKQGRRGRRRAGYLWARRVLNKRGGLILVAARYIPAGRTTVTMTAGAVHYSFNRFLVFIAIAGLTWGFYSALLGYAGGVVFEEDPILGVVVGIGTAIAITALTEAVRFGYRWRKRTRVSAVQVSDDTTAPVSELDKR